MLIFYRYFGLWIDAELNRGETRTSQAFKNQPLTGTADSQFSCVAVVAYMTVPSVHTSTQLVMLRSLYHVSRMTIMIQDMAL